MEEVNPFIGTWESEISGYRTVFTDDVITVYYPNNDVYWTGIYAYNETHITAILDIAISAQEMIDVASNGVFVTKYAFADGKLYLNANSHIMIEWHLFLTYIHRQ